MDDLQQWREHYDLVRASTGHRPAKIKVPRKPGGPALSLPALPSGKSLHYIMVAVGFLGFFFFPQTEQTRDYAYSDVMRQIETRLGARVAGRYRLIEADPFPDLSLPYDLVVIVENDDYRTGATVKGELGIDWSLSAIRIINPNEVRPLDVEHLSDSTASSAASYAPGFLKDLASVAGGLLDSQGEIRAQSDAQSAARNFVIHRIDDRDLSLFETKAVRRVERRADRLSVVYVDGWSPSRWSPVYWLFIALFVGSLASSIAKWR